MNELLRIDLIVINSNNSIIVFSFNSYLKNFISSGVHLEKGFCTQQQNESRMRESERTRRPDEAEAVALVMAAVAGRKAAGTKRTPSS